MKKCIRCEFNKLDEQFHSSRGKLYSYCKDCVSELDKNRYIRNRGEMLAKRKEWRDANRVKINERRKLQWKEFREKVLIYYSNGTLKCACVGCDECDYEFLTIDHINGGGRKHVKEIKINIYKWLVKNDYPSGFRVLCMNCNHSYGHYGYCPHQFKMAC